MKTTTAFAGALAAVAFQLGSAAPSETLQKCQQALSDLMLEPGKTSLPFLAASTGHFDLGYSYQNQVLAVFPPKVMGSFDMCQSPKVYSFDAVQTHYCALGTDKAGICVPKECTDLALLEGVNSMPFITFLATLNINATMKAPPPCAFDPFLTPFCAEAIAQRDYFDNLYQNLMIFGKMGVSCGGGATPADTGSRFMYAITFILILCACVGTLWEYVRRKAEAQAALVPNTISPRLPAVGQPQAPHVAKREVPVFFKAFDIKANIEEIFNLSVRPGEFSCFDGMRAISCGWVIIYHVILWQTRFIANPEALLPPTGVLAEWWSMPLFNFSGTLCVDTFLFISAFLAAFLLLKKLEKETRPVSKWLPMVYVNRFVRITPAYMFAFFLNWKLAPTLSEGPMAKAIWANSNKNCPILWWRHLLYINTISPWMFKGAACFGHTWYLANDMMYFITVPLIVILYRKGNMGRLAAWGVVCTILAGSILYQLVAAAEHHWSPNTWDGDEADLFHEEAFNKPYTRCPSYYIGILVAFCWYEKKRLYPTYKFPAFLARSMAVFAALVMLLIQYGPASGSKGITACIIQKTNCGSDWSRGTKTAIAAFARPGWTIGLATLCLLCFNGQGGLVNKFLSAPIFSPFSFLSYSTYLTHFTILTYYMASLTARYRWEWFDFIVVYLGLTAYSHLLGLFVALIVEKPAMKLQKHYLEVAPKKKAASGDQAVKAAAK